jgi:hypothetical protein
MSAGFSTFLRDKQIAPLIISKLHERQSMQDVSPGFVLVHEGQSALNKLMKTKIIVLAALIGVAAMSANAGIRVGFSIGLPLPVVVTTPAVVAVPIAPAPVAVVPAGLACPGVGYVWAPGCWSYHAGGYAWVPGGWRYGGGRGGYYYHGRRW